jgi:hypothetical protein
MTIWKMLELKNSLEPLGNLLNAYSKPNVLKLLPFVDKA